MILYLSIIHKPSDIGFIYNLESGGLLYPKSNQSRHIDVCLWRAKNNLLNHINKTEHVKLFSSAPQDDFLLEICGDEATITKLIELYGKPLGIATRIVEKFPETEVNQLALAKFKGMISMHKHK